MVKKIAISILSLFFLTLVSPLSLATARLPVFTGNYSINNTLPTVDRSVSVTVDINIYDPDGQQIPFGILTLYLYWSRDKTTWVSTDMEPLDEQTYKGIIPAQDGSYNVRYDDGAGPCYWFVRMKNDANDQSTFFTSLQPNDDITYVDPWATPETTPANVTGEPIVVGDLLGAPLAIFQTIFDPTADPFVRIVLISLIVIIVFIIASRGRGLGALNWLFKRG